MGKLTEYFAILNDKKAPTADSLSFADFGIKEKRIRKKYRKELRIKKE